jgi:hypothetical protein
MWVQEAEDTKLRIIHNEELCDLYCLPNVIWVTKSTGHASRKLGEEKCFAAET